MVKQIELAAAQDFNMPIFVLANSARDVIHEIRTNGAASRAARYI